MVTFHERKSIAATGPIQNLPDDNDQGLDDVAMVTLEKEQLQFEALDNDALWYIEERHAATRQKPNKDFYSAASYTQGGRYENLPRLYILRWRIQSLFGRRILSRTKVTLKANKKRTLQTATPSFKEEAARRRFNTQHKRNLCW